MKKIKKDKWIKIGQVGVDSGTLMICDPCYLGGWKDVDYTDSRGVIDVKTNDIYMLWKDFNGYEDIIKGYTQTVNALVKDGTFKHVNNDELFTEFDYNGATHMGNKSYKQLCESTAVSFRSGLGDGLYEVFAKIGEVKGWGERVKEVKIKLI